MAVRMDLDRLETVSDAPVLLSEQVRVGGLGANYAVSDSGQLVYVPGNVRRYERQLVWVNLKGGVEAVPLPVRVPDPADERNQQQPTSRLDARRKARGVSRNQTWRPRPVLEAGRCRNRRRTVDDRGRQFNAGIVVARWKAASVYSKC